MSTFKDQHLAEIEARAAVAAELQCDVRALVATVRRLQQENERLRALGELPTAEVLSAALVERIRQDIRAELGVPNVAAAGVVEGEFAANLRRLRHAAGLTQEKLADRCGVARETIASLEVGMRTNPTMETAVAIARALRCRVDDLV